MSFIEFKHIGKKYAGAEHKSVDDFNLNMLFSYPVLPQIDISI